MKNSPDAVVLKLPEIFPEEGFCNPQMGYVLARSRIKLVSALIWAALL